MVTTLFQIFLVISIMIILYAFFRYFRSAERQLTKAIRLSKYFLLDDYDNVNINLRIAYKGCLFEGEKHLGIANDAYKVIRINMSVYDKFELRGINHEDLLYLEEKIHEHYPHAMIKWLHPISYLA